MKSILKVFAIESFHIHLKIAREHALGHLELLTIF